MKSPLLTALLLFVPPSLQAEPVVLEPVTITSTRMERPLADTPAAITVVDGQDAQRGQPHLQLDESLNQVPGLYLQNRYNFAQGLRLSSRGFGSRAPFGVRGLRLNVDGFPETLPDGQSQLDSIDLFAVDRLTVLRGPSSLLYGNASGGVVDISTFSTPLAESARATFIAGGDGLQQANLQTTGRHQHGHHALSLTALGYDGFRDQSEVRKYQLTAQTGWALADDNALTVFLTAMDTPTANDPGGLTRAQANESPRQAATFADRLDAGQEVDQQRLGVHYRHGAMGNGQLNARIFVSQRDFRQQLPFPGSSLIDYDRLFYGSRIDYTLPFLLRNRPHRFMVGMDADRQQDRRGRRAVNGTGSITGTTADEDQHASATGMFIQMDSHVTNTLMLTLGARQDRLRLTIEDNLLFDGDDSGRREFDEQSYSAGLAWQVSPRHTVYTSVSSAFESPTFTELANPSGAGGFDPSLEPQSALNLELGARGALNDRLFYEATLFRVDVNDEITPYEIGGRTFYQNAGETRREGIELALEHATTDRLTLSLAWTGSDFRFTDFFDTQQNTAVSGNRLPGLPEHQLFGQARWQADQGFFASIEGLFSSHRYAENTNTTRIGSAFILNVRGGREWTYPQQTLSVFAGISNLLDRDYYSNLRINANSDRAVEDRAYFEPGPGAGFYAGVGVGF